MKRKFALILFSCSLLLITACSAGATSADPIAHAKETLSISIYTPTYLPEGFELNPGSSYFVDDSLFLSYKRTNGEGSLEIFQDEVAKRDINAHIYKFLDYNFSLEDGVDPNFYEEIGDFVGKYNEKEKFKVFHFQFIPKDFKEKETKAHYVIKSKGISEEEFKKIIKSLTIKE